MSTSCIFCRIISGEIPSPRILETESAIVIRDIQPQAPTHLLVIPKKHCASLDELFTVSSGAEEAVRSAGELLSIAHRAAQLQGLLPGGFRTVINTGEQGGQTVFHLHVHVLGGRSLAGGFA